MTPCISSTGQKLYQSPMPSYQEVTRMNAQPPSSQDTVLSSPTPKLSSAPRPAALGIAVLSVLLSVLLCQGGFPALFPILFILSHYRSHYSVPNHYQGPTTISSPPTSTAELCPILSFPPVSLQSWVNILLQFPCHSASTWTSLRVSLVFPQQVLQFPSS